MKMLCKMLAIKYYIQIVSQLETRFACEFFLGVLPHHATDIMYIIEQFPATLKYNTQSVYWKTNIEISPNVSYLQS